jgi:hypothetical protein
MGKIAYITKKLSASKLRVIEQANTIIEEYQVQGYELTLRQLYYQFVARDLLPNKMKEYQRLSIIISDGRLCGLVDWDAIVDRTRNLQKNSHWESPGEIVEICSKQYKIDRWEGQEYRPEVWIEKDALVGVIEKVCRSLDVSFFSCRGYTSQSEMHAAAKRLEQYAENGQTPVIIHLGDHDPSGIDMSRDIFDRMEMFMGGLEVKRIALNRDQIDRFKPPPNPAKFSDPRAHDYVKKHGAVSWELDALEPKVLDALIRSTITPLIDMNVWKKREKLEAEHKALLVKTAKGMK